MKQYTTLAHWWPLLSPAEEYAQEAAFFAGLITNSGLPANATLLELGCGGGSNAYHLKPLFDDVMLTDLSNDMLAVSRQLNPDCEHRQGDMRTMRLDRQFDVVFTHDAIDFMTTVRDLGAAISTAFTHCKPGGIALFVPDHVHETFEPCTEHGGTDGDGQAMRFLEWCYTDEGQDTTYTAEYVYLLREGGGPAKVEHERLTCGLFKRDEWLHLIGAAGFEVQTFTDDFGRELFLATRPRS